MSNILYERHRMANPELPFIFHTDFRPSNESGVANWHENTEFLCCIEGEGTVKCDTADIAMKKGDTVIINARQLHTVYSATNVKYHCLIIDNSFFKDNGVDIETLSFRHIISDTKAEEMFKTIAELFQNRDGAFYVSEIRLAVLCFVVHICKNFSVQTKTKTKKISKSYAAVLEAVEYINENFSQKLTLDHLSARAGFSRFHFARIFKENTGFTVVEHINAIRCENAGHMLRETQKPISQICFECGFDSPSYFAKAFSKLYGVLPSEHRQLHSKL